MNGDEAPTEKLRLAVVHWFPLEQYPPTMNMLRLFGNTSNFLVRSYSTHNDRGRTPFECPEVTIHRTPFPGKGNGRLFRAWCFLAFPLFTFFRLLWFRPHVLLYLEPHSSLPAYLYCKLHRSCRLFIHYHEYRERSEYDRPGMRLVARLHQLEQSFLYNRAEWVSHTNTDRIRMFLEDLPQVCSGKVKAIANLPPKSWRAAQKYNWPATSEEPLRIIYVGAVSARDTFVVSVIEWMQKLPSEQVSLDIFTNNIDRETDKLLRESNDHNITYHAGGVDYDALPSVLHRYHVGLVLYKGTTLNYVFNAPNKLFEYLMCGLDVWYPPVMLGVKPYARENAWPRVIEVDFENLDALDMDTVRSREGLPHVPWTDTCESQLAILEAEMRKRTECLVDKTGA